MISYSSPNIMSCTKFFDKILGAQISIVLEVTLRISNQRKPVKYDALQYLAFLIQTDNLIILCAYFILNLFVNWYYIECIHLFTCCWWTSKIWWHFLTVFFLSCNAQPFGELYIAQCSCHIILTACTFCKIKTKFSSVLFGQRIYFTWSIGKLLYVQIVVKLFSCAAESIFLCVFINNTNFNTKVLQLQEYFLQDSVWTKSCVSLLS